MDELAAAREPLEAVERTLGAAVGRIAAALAAPPPRDRAAVEAAVREVQGQIIRAQPVFAGVQRAQGEAARRAAEAGQRLPEPWHALAARAGHLRVALNQWPRIEPVIRAQVAERQRKLVPVSAPEAAARAALGDDIFDHLHRILNPLAQDPAAAGRHAHPDIGLPQSRFVALAHAAYRVGLAQGRRETRFLDVGCGIGLKLLSAARFFDSVAGIELDPGYAARAQSFLAAAGLETAEVHEGDARSFGGYGDFDVIYLFLPIRDAAEMAGLEARIGAAVAPGTLVIGPYRGLAARHRAAGLAPLAPGLYVAGAGRSAAALRRLAETTGPAVRPPAEPLRTVWTPVLDAARAMGFDVAREGPLDHV